VTDPDTTLGRIDDVLAGALDDSEVSSDAMRWTPPASDHTQLIQALQVILPDGADPAAYLDACDGIPSLAAEYALLGVPPEHVRDLRDRGVTAMQYTITADPTDRSTT